MSSIGVGIDQTEQWLTQPSLQVLVRERLEEAIIAGVYQPGEHLVETELASKLGVSRGPIREALHLLEAQGWVDRRPRQGSFVHEPSLDEASHFFHVRMLLEGECAALAAEHATSEAIEALRATIVEARAAISAGDEPFLIHSNTIFHGYIHELSHNKVLRELTESLGKRMRWYFSPLATERAVDAWDEHEDLLDALARSDRDSAVRIMRAHSQKTFDAYVQWRNESNT